ncbi:EP300-interacting inhibitor of differentiation 3 [Ochlerotatus camptorhynchus]|uniref:EP300-interacting inhibitor of differentiation 3 n=1 Tax=Ochlerotatus camptorhynchus TaxID=644619 RepID=UPI0031D4CD96
MDREEIKTKMQRSLRKQKYKQLLEEGAQLGLRAETTDPVETFQAVTKILETSNALQSEGRIKDRAENATEVLMDAQVLKMSHDVVHAAMQKMGSSEFSDDEFVGVILSSFDAEQGIENWDKITREAAAVFLMSKHNQSLYGTFEHEPVVVQKEAKQRSQRQRTDFGEAKKPSTVDKLLRREKTAQKLNLIFNQIRKIFEQRRHAIPYYELIIDPEDFMNTVDNAFQISFLIRDGRVALLKDDNDEPTIRPTTQEENEQAQRMNETTQAIFGLNPKKWREMIERFQVDEPMLILNREELNLTQSQK